MSKVLNEVGLNYLWSKLKAKLDGKASKDHDHTNASASVDGFMSAADKSKLDSITSGANAYTHPTTSGYKHIPSGGKSGQILRWSADGTATWGADNDTTYSNASTSAAGLMSASDKSKLDGIASGANAYIHPTTSGNKHIPSGGSSGQILRWSSDGTAVWGADNDTTYSNATRSAAGLMSADDKTKLDGIAAGANAYTHPTSHPASMITGLSTVATSGSYDDLINKPTIPAAYTHPNTHPASMITGLATVATSGSYNDLADKPNIPEGVVVDSSLSSTSTNAIQNKVVNAALDGKANSTHSHAMSEITGNIDCGTF